MLSAQVDKKLSPDYSSESTATKMLNSAFATQETKPTTDVRAFTYLARLEDSQ